MPSLTPRAHHLHVFSVIVMSRHCVHFSKNAHGEPIGGVGAGYASVHTTNDCE